MRVGRSISDKRQIRCILVDVYQIRDILYVRW